MLENSIPDLFGEIQAFTFIFKHVHHPQTLVCVGKMGGMDFDQGGLSTMTKGGVAQIMAQGYGFGKIFVYRKGPGNISGNF